MSIVDKSPKINKAFKGVATLLITLGCSLSLGAQEALTLKQCIDYGLRNHPAISVARNNVANAKQASREALAAYLPQVNVNGELDNNLKLQTNVIPASPPLFPTETKLTFGNKYSNTVTAQADQPIYNQSLLTGLKANKPNQEMAQLNEAQTRQTLIYNIASYYFQIITAQKQLELLRGNRDRIAKMLDVAKLQSEMGVAKKVDVKQVQVNLNNVTAQISVAENTLELATNSLKNAMGIYDDRQIVPSDTAKWLNYQPVLAAPTGFKAKNTLSYLIQDKQIELYDINARSIKAKGVPVVSAFARYGLNGFGTEFDKLFTRQFDYSTVGLKVSWSLFDGFRRNAQYKQALYQKENAKLNQEISLSNESLQYQNAESQYKQASSTLNTNRDNVTLAAQVYDNVSLQYKEGVGSLSDLLNAESSYSDAQNNYIQSLIRFYLAQLELEKTNSTIDDYYNKL